MTSLDPSARPELSSSIQLLLDLEAIRAVAARYDRAFVERDADTLLGCVTSDCHIERRNAEPRVSGHVEIAEMVRSFPVEGFRVSTGLEIEIDGDRARVRQALLYVDQGPPMDISMMGSWDDELVRTDDGWKFSRRVFDPFAVRESEDSSNFRSRSAAFRSDPDTPDHDNPGEPR